MSDSQSPEQQLQSILSNVSVGGNLTTRDITQIYKIVVNLDSIPKPQGVPQNIISSSTDKFVGRERELESLNQQLQRHNQVVVAAVEGMGGIGKTELAIQYSLLNLQLETYPGGICWIRAREQDIGLQIVNFARTDLDLKPPDDLELPGRVRWCWKRWREGNALIVFDDVKNYSDIKPYLPSQPSQFKVLITTRLKLDLPSSLYLAVLTEPDGLELLSQLVGQGKVQQELEIAKELCQRLGNLPLALQLVGRYVKQRKISLTEELRRLEEKGLGHPSMSVPENDPSWTLDIKRGVEAAFELSWSELSESAQELGCILSLFALVSIPWSLVESAIASKSKIKSQKSKGLIFLSLKVLQMLHLCKRQSSAELDPESLEDARVELENLHLLQSESKDTSELHQLIREFFRKKQNNLANRDEQKYNFCTAIVEVAKKIPETPTLSEITSLSPFIPHLSEAVTVYQNCLRDEDLIAPFTGLGWFYKGQGAYAQALPWLEKCVSVARERLVENHSDVATSLHILALLYSYQGQYQEAEPLFQKSLELFKCLLGEEHPHVASSLHELARLYLYQGRYEQAEPLLRQALELFKRLLGEEHPDVASSLHHLALLYLYQGRYEQAEPLFRQALELFKRLLGEEHPDVATSLHELALLHLYQGRYEQAEPLFRQALELYKRLLGEEHPDVATNLNNLASLYFYQGRYEQAKPLFRQALELRKRLLGEEHPDVATSLNDLALLYFKQGRYEEAEPLFRQALELRKRLLGEEHPYVATSLNNLALLYSKQGRYEEAEPLYLQALELYKRLLGEEHPNVATNLNNLANLYSNQGRYEEAEPLYLQALELRKRLLGEEHPDVATSLDNLALLYSKQGRYEEAEPLYLQALEIAEKSLGGNHPTTIKIRENLKSLGDNNP
jgi:tetratricopeptide (TPR) repeat protein